MGGAGQMGHPQAALVLQPSICFIDTLSMQTRDNIEPGGDFLSEVLDTMMRKEFIGDRYAEQLINKVDRLNKEQKAGVNTIEVMKALFYVKEWYGEPKRATKVPLYAHPLQVACLVAEYCPHTTTIVTAVLHNMLQDTAFGLPRIKKLFGPDIAYKVEGLTRANTDRKLSAAEAVYALYLHKKDKDILTVKLCDELHKMQHMGNLELEERQQKASETFETFMPLAADLGLYKLEKRLQALCHSILCPESMEQKTSEAPTKATFSLWPGFKIN